MKSRKGTVRDMIIIVVIVFAVSLGSVAVYGGVKEVSDVLHEMNSTDDSSIPDESLNFIDNSLKALLLTNAGSVFLMALLFLGAGYSAFQIRASKIFIIPSLFFFISSLYLAGILSDTYLIIANTPVITPWFNQFGLQVEMFENFGGITAVLGALLFIATYMKTRGPSTEAGL